MTTHQEDEVLERLNEQDGPRGFFLEVVTILEEAVDSLMRRAFRQEEYAVKYAIEPLLNQRDRKSTRLNSSHSRASRMPSSA